MEEVNITRRRTMEGVVPVFDPDSMLGSKCPTVRFCAGCGQSIRVGKMMVEAKTQEGELVSFHPACGMVVASELLNRLRRKRLDSSTV